MSLEASVRRNDFFADIKVGGSAFNLLSTQAQDDLARYITKLAVDVNCRMDMTVKCVQIEGFPEHYTGRQITDVVEYCATNVQVHHVYGEQQFKGTDSKDTVIVELGSDAEAERVLLYLQKNAMCYCNLNLAVVRPNSMPVYGLPSYIDQFQGRADESLKMAGSNGHRFLPSSKFKTRSRSPLACPPQEDKSSESDQEESDQESFQTNQDGDLVDEFGRIPEHRNK